MALLTGFAKFHFILVLPTVSFEDVVAIKVHQLER